MFDVRGARPMLPGRRVVCVFLVQVGEEGPMSSW